VIKGFLRFLGLIKSYEVIYERKIVDGKHSNRPPSPPPLRLITESGGRKPYSPEARKILSFDGKKPKAPHLRLINEAGDKSFPFGDE